MNFIGAQTPISGPPPSPNWQYDICLKEVHFAGTNLTNYVPIVKDNGSATYLAPQFAKNHTGGCKNSTGGQVVNQFPVAYVSGTKAKVKAVFTMACSAPHSFWIRGVVSPSIVPGGIVFSPQEVSVKSPPVDLIYDFKEANVVFEDKRVRFIEHFKIQWEFGNSENGPWLPIDESDNNLYITHEKALAGTYAKGTYKVRESSLHNGCKAANGKNTKDDIVMTIHDNYFAGANSKDKFGTPLTYWGQYSGSSCVNLDDFFAKSDGTCGTWTWYFLEVLDIQGIAAIEKIIEPNPLMVSPTERLNLIAKFTTDFPDESIIEFGTVLWFMVKTWSNQQYFNLGNDPNLWQHDPGGAGIKGQNNNEPTSIHLNHGFMQYGSIFYDPSYGNKIAADLAEYEDASIDVVKAVYFSTQNKTNRIITFRMYQYKRNKIDSQELSIR